MLNYGGTGQGAYGGTGASGGASGAASITSGTIALDAGSAASPSLQWAADNDGSGTGLYRVGANIISFSANGGERFRVESGQVLTFVNLLAGAGGGLGFGGSAGGTVTQATSKATGVTLNFPNGQITLNAASLAATTSVAFTLTSSSIGANDLVVINHVSGGTAGAYSFCSTPAAGSTVITVRNLTAGALAEAIVLQYAVIRGSIA